MDQTPDDWTEEQWREWETAQCGARFPDRDPGYLQAEDE